MKLTVNEVLTKLSELTIADANGKCPHHHSRPPNQGKPTHAPNPDIPRPARLAAAYRRQHLQIHADRFLSGRAGRYFEKPRLQPEPTELDTFNRRYRSGEGVVCRADGAAAGGAVRSVSRPVSPPCGWQRRSAMPMRIGQRWVWPYWRAGCCIHAEDCLMRMNRKTQRKTV